MKTSSLICLFLTFCFTFSISFGQTLNLPVRPSGAMNGTQFVAYITSMNFSNREAAIYNELAIGNIPDFYRTLVPVTSVGTVSGSTQSITYFVTPDYLAVGHDTDYFLCPMSPMLATQIGTLINGTLPTRKMVNDIWSAATVKLSPSTIAPGPGMTTVPVFAQHNATVSGQRQAVIATHPLGELVAGDKKDVVISNQIYNTANRVVIYGWHQTNGSAIQPLSNVHGDTYMDYSHGIRMVQNNVVYNGNPTTIQAILQSSTLYPLLSDEGQMSQPWYPYGQAITSLAVPVSFAVINHSATSLKLLVSNDPNVTDYKVYLSTNGSTFSAPINVPVGNPILSGLISNIPYFVKIAAFNSTYSVTSAATEVLAAIPSAASDSILIVNAFDRASTGNTYDFAKEHGLALKAAQKNFESATNEAISNGLVNLTDYKIVDVLLGEESTSNETFSSTEQQFYSNYLNNGGFLFVSGAEIGWDLDHLGSPSDKAFYNDYLKASYVMDAPSNTASFCYTALTDSIQNSLFYSLDSINFDDGTNGTYNVDYPDVILPVNGASANLHYTTHLNEIAGIHFSGLFPSGTKAGKLVHLAFPFETIYPQSLRDSVMNDVLEYFTGITQNPVHISQKIPKTEITVYPNPFHSSFIIEAKLELDKIQILDELGRDLTGSVLLVPITKTKMQIDLSKMEKGLYYLIINGKSKKIFKQS